MCQGNDPNVGRLASSIGDFIGSSSGGGPDALARCEIRMGGRLLCQGGEFTLDHETEEALSAHMKDAEQVNALGRSFSAALRHPGSRHLCCAYPAQQH